VILVTGSVHARPDTIDQVVASSLEHVHRSRHEPGCLLHSVHFDAEDPLHLVFVEHWADADALRAHFGVPASRAFAKELGTLAAEPPEMKIYDAQNAAI
jgi:quinol monooxygenase YgiN